MRWRQRALLALTAGVLAGVLAAAASPTRLVRQLNATIFDRYTSNWHYPADPSLLIVAIDPSSLQQIGPWPWPRSVHAHLLNRLTDAGAARVVLDLPLYESDLQADADLAAALRRNGRVVLPVQTLAASGQRIAEERLPIPLLAGSAAALGQGEVSIDPDGIARGLYLHAGVGSPHWPALGLALADPPFPSAGLRPTGTADGSFQGQNDDPVLMRHPGPPGTLPRVSYVDVLEGRIDRSQLQGRRIVVGATAPSMAPLLRTPVAARRGITRAEFHADVASMLLQHRTLRALPPAWQHGGVALWVAACMLALSGGVAANRIGMLAGLSLPLPLSLALLRASNLWWAPATAMVTVLVAVVLWSVWRIRTTPRRSGIDRLTGLANRQRFEQTLSRECKAAQGPLSLVLIDVDDIDDPSAHPGHPSAGRVLTRVASLVAAHARRPRDTPARVGSRTLAMVLPDTPASGARQVVEELMADVRRLRVEASDPTDIRVTLSIGVFCAAAVPAQALLSGASAALDQARASADDTYVLVSG